MSKDATKCTSMIENTLFLVNMRIISTSKICKYYQLPLRLAQQKQRSSSPHPNDHKVLICRELLVGFNYYSILLPPSHLSYHYIVHYQFIFFFLQSGPLVSCGFTSSEHKWHQGLWIIFSMSFNFDGFSANIDIIEVLFVLK